MPTGALFLKRLFVAALNQQDTLKGDFSTLVASVDMGQQLARKAIEQGSY
ncbi:hypothetical protein [Hymenobacter radiodurans]|nr:hypothetical protein [Hymenobacter radiodurans]